jgi:hypothetical protein
LPRKQKPEQKSKDPATKEPNCKSVADLACLFLAVQKRDFYFAGQKLCFIRFDEPQDMHSAYFVAGNNRPPV